MNISNPNKLFGSKRLSVNAMRPFVHDDGKTYIINNNSKELHTNDGLLMYDEWKDLDRNVVEVATDRLVGIADLQSRGLTYNLGSLGVTYAQWEMSSDMTPADFSMSGVSEGEEDTTAYKQDAVPIPIVHKDFRLNIRRLEASRRFGSALDVQNSTTAARLVAEASEDMLFAGKPIVVDGKEIYGYTNHPQRNTESFSDVAWDQTTDNENIFADVQAMMDAARDDNYYGPFTLYVPGNYESTLEEDFKPGSGDTRTVRERLLQINMLDNIVVADRLADDNVVLVQLTSDVVDLAVAQDVTTVQWSNDGGMSEEFKVMAAWAPRVKNDYDDKSGLVHLS